MKKKVKKNVYAAVRIGKDIADTEVTPPSDREYRSRQWWTRKTRQDTVAKQGTVANNFSIAASSYTKLAFFFFKPEEVVNSSGSADKT